MRERRARGFRRRRGAATRWRLSAALPAILPLLVGVALAKTTWRVLAPAAVVVAAAADDPDYAWPSLPPHGSSTPVDDAPDAGDDGSRTSAVLPGADSLTHNDARSGALVLLAWVFSPREARESDGARRSTWGRDPPGPRGSAASSPFSPRAPPDS